MLGPIVADLAPPHLLGRYMSLYGLTFTAGVALGPAVGVQCSRGSAPVTRVASGASPRSPDPARFRGGMSRYSSLVTR